MTSLMVAYMKSGPAAARWLNALDPNSEQRRRVERLIEAAAEPWLNTYDGLPEATINRLRAGTYHPVLFQLSPQLRVASDEYAAAAISARGRSGPTPDESYVVYTIVQLAMLGKRTAFRRCDQCGKWIFARNSAGSRSQRFCPGGKCLKRWRETSEEYKKAQRERVRASRNAERELALTEQREWHNKEHIARRRFNPRCTLCRKGRKSGSRKAR